MDQLRLPGWLSAAVASMGGLGLFVVAFLDSSVLSLPVINDLLVIHLSIQNPLRMPFYAAMATMGSLAGSVMLYLLAKKGGEALFRRSAGGRAGRIRAWLDRNSFLAVAVPSILPPPMPFKAFVLAAGVFQVRMVIFVLALVLGRGFRYLAEGLLAVRYGADAARMISQHRLAFTLIVVALILASYLLTRAVFRNGKAATPEKIS